MLRFVTVVVVLVGLLIAPLQAQWKGRRISNREGQVLSGTMHGFKHQEDEARVSWNHRDESVAVMSGDEETIAAFSIQELTGITLLDYRARKAGVLSALLTPGLFLPLWVAPLRSLGEGDEHHLPITADEAMDLESVGVVLVVSRSEQETVLMQDGADSRIVAESLGVLAGVEPDYQYFRVVVEK